MVDFQYASHYTVDDLRRIMEALRAPDGCPWDREQTHSSIRRNFLEETYEVLDAIDHDDASGMCEELGDMLFAAVRVASTLERDPEQALHAACEKFIRRFTAMEQTALAEGRPLETLSKDELLAGWNAQKRVVPGGEQ